MASLAWFLDGAGGCQARSTPQLEDEASATDLCKEKKNEKQSAIEAGKSRE
jgi:hypothetical protein